MEWLFLAIGAAIGVAATIGYSRTRSATAPSGPDAPAPTALVSPADAVAARAKVQDLAKSLEEACEQAERGLDLAADPRFPELVELVASTSFDAEQRMAWVTSRNLALSCAALAAMPKAGDDRRVDVARMIGRLGYLSVHFALEYLRDSADPGVAGLVLARAQYWWPDHAGTREALLTFLQRQQELGVVPVLPEAAIGSDWELEERRELLRQMPHPLIDRFIGYLTGLDRLRRGQREVARVGRAVTAEPNGDEDAIARTAGVRERIDALLEALQRPGRPSYALVGPEGAGKSTVARAALRELAAQGWRVVEATPSQLLAGQKYIGELEQRLENFVAGIGGERAIWFVPECHQLLEQGSSSGNRTGLFDRLLPYLERGELQLLGESSIEAWTRVLASMPRVDALITGLKVEAMSDAATLALAREWATRGSAQAGTELIGDAALVEACELARQHFPQRVEPGRTMELLKDALSAANSQVPPSLPIDREQLLGALARRSGLPMEILDTGQPLDVAAVRKYFADRVIGQDEAVDSLVDRVSMLKAGLTDPGRPIGVFLFAGPTGTGKTEIAKTLAKFLFGSPDRMLRVDMSEYQAEDSQWRLIGDSKDGSSSLTTRVRQQPFSVVLLDEFEKAHPRIWDLFLQVFDDGRLTDRSGNTADFRHCIIILTSNLGSTISRGGGPGFLSSRGGFSREMVDRAIDSTFRREFINRLDRVVVFQPLTRALMRDILHKELRSVLERRGFRSRDWAVEWEPSAIEFLLERGFTPDLGARPLRRAIDQFLLAPLSRTIVEHRVPTGEQFLFVQGGADALQVRFVDPDAPAVPSAAPAVAAGVTPADLRALALDPRAGPETLGLLRRGIDDRERAIAEPAWLDLKERYALEMQRGDFWNRGDRHVVLDRLERIDRIESGIRSAAALHARLARSGGRGASDLVRRLALLVTSLGQAVEAVLHDESEDAMIEIRPTDPRSAQSLAWRDRIAEMYARWGEARGVRMQGRGADPVSGVLLIEASGFGAWRVLRGEAGMHLLESRMGELDLRQSVRVSVRPIPDDKQATGGTESDSRICRRYDDGPSPLVRDTVRGWRTGRLERVLSGDFDLVGEA